MSNIFDPAQTDIISYLREHERKDLLRFLTCGSVDDGKSTLIGRLLFDSKMVYEDHLKQVKDATQKYGTTGTDFDPALLTDGLKAEREQGITIDVAYRYFSTAKRKFIIADTPGHEQFTRNMATGASNCDLAIILIDARYGVVTQTRRHSFIVSLLGIKHVIVAVNKMDLVGFDEKIYNKICADYSDFAANLEIPDIRFIPMSALKGDNVVNASTQSPWYQGGTLMHHLESVHVASDRNLIDLRLPVQSVLRPNLNFRGFAGTMASGRIKPGDAVTALPSGKSSRVKSVLVSGAEAPEAFAGQACVVTLEDEVDIARGDMLVHPGNRPRVTQSFEAMMVWMSESPLVAGKSYLVKQTTCKSPGTISSVRYRMDVNTLKKQDAAGLALNEIGRVTVELDRPIACDSYKKNRGTGAFIVIDRLTNNTVACGMILDHDPAAGSAAAVALSERTPAQAAKSGVPIVAAFERAARFGHEPALVCLTGKDGSGRRALASMVARRLFDAGGLAVALEPCAESASLLAAGGIALVPWDAATTIPGGALHIHLADGGAEAQTKADLVLRADQTPLAKCVEAVAELLRDKGVVKG